jgi:hypothetical protein
MLPRARRSSASFSTPLPDGGLAHRTRFTEAEIRAELATCTTRQAEAPIVPPAADALLEALALFDDAVARIVEAAPKSGALKNGSSAESFLIPAASFASRHRQYRWR